MIPTRALAALAALLLCCPALATPAQPPAVLPLPPDWYPESVAIGPDGSFYVGSWRQGAVARLRPAAEGTEDWQPEVLVPPGSNGLANGQGVLVDAQDGRLWVCSGSMGFTTVPMTPSALKAYDLATGAPRGSWPMPGSGYCNDLAQDGRGTLYITDSLHPRVLRLRPGATALEVWTEDPALGGGEGGYFLNGIAVTADGLYVSAVAAVPYILRVGIGAGGAAGPVVRVPAPRVLRNVDAIRADGPGRLVLFESNAFGTDGPYGGAVTLARVADGRIAALETVVGGLNDASSGVVAGGRVWFIESKYGLLLAHKGDDAAVPRGVPFDLQSRALPE
jgi:sugar lactone lactonase YvrE